MQFAEGLTDRQAAEAVRSRIDWKYALNQLATVADEWLLTVVNQDWSARYATRFEQYRLPKSQTEKQSLALTIGSDGYQLLSALYDPLTPEWLRHLKAVEILRCVWVQQYCATCPVRSQCTHSPTSARVLTLKLQPLYEA